MNERILEIAKQAGLKFPSETDLSLQEKKFAELLIRECVLHLHRRGVEGFGILEERNLKEHFGVE